MPVKTMKKYTYSKTKSKSKASKKYSNHKYILSRTVRSHHKFFDVRLGTTTAGSVGNIMYRANGMYDPYAYTFGAQPRGFDQMAALYDHFVVIGSKISVTLTCQPENIVEGLIVGIALVDNSTASTTTTDYMERPGQVSWRYVNPQNPQVTVTLACNPNKFLNRNVKDDEVKGSAAGDPTEQCYFHVFVSNFNGSSTQTDRFKLSTLVEYEAVWFEPKNPSQS